MLGCGRNVVVDLGFALDGSNSIDSNEYRLTKDFVKDIIRSFSISEQGTHVGLLEYASEASIKVYFDDYDDTNELLMFVEGLTQARAARWKNCLFSSRMGTNTDRDEDLTQYTRQIKNRGIRTIAVGVGSDTNATELATIASSENNVFRLDEFEELKLIIKDLTPIECQGDLP
ncbi:hypothetical protein OS493_006281 [Desmophyllum pertusum]|uniref:VWFA domain-containing protein n=1 Tax=Desmophyllum pertusum TaxID=174260 RepID=A0A9X0DB94_9CNID|nr:hypothetical protein OS493_006281 [Desmophyllum pertusum]